MRGMRVGALMKDLRWMLLKFPGLDANWVELVRSSVDPPTTAMSSDKDTP